jgi:hypothetical protein
VATVDTLPEARKKQFYNEPGVVALQLAFRGATALLVFVAYFVLNGALFLFRPLFVGSSSLLAPVLEAMVVLVHGAVIKLLVVLSRGTALGLLPDLFPQILLERCLLRFGG